MGVGGIVICPEGYNWCIKETVSGDLDQCGNYEGTTDYFGDTIEPNNNLCVYRKCARDEECSGHSSDNNPASTVDFGANDDWTRERYCCQTKPGFRGAPCNDAVGRFGGGSPMLVLVMTVVIIILLH